jgi:glucose/galactose transporter
VLGAFVLKDIGKLEEKVRTAIDPQAKEIILKEFASTIYVPYMIMALILGLLSFWILKSALPEIKASDVNVESAGSAAKNKTSIFQFPYLLLGSLCIFVYVGAEVMAGDAIGTYGKGFNIPTDETKYFTSFTLVGMLIGYLLGLITIPKIITQQTALKISALLGMVFTIAALLTTGYVSVGFVAALGLANALMWPAIWPLAIEGLGKFTERGSALLIMGIAGGAIIPKIFASLIDQYDFQWMFFALMMPCYLFILFYAVKGCKVGRS